MIQKFKLIAQVVAINAKGETADFELEKSIPAEIEPTEQEKELFFGDKFRGKMVNSDPQDFVVIEVKRLKCIPEPFYISVIDGKNAGSQGYIRLGNYDHPDDLNPLYRVSPLTGLTLNFEMRSGEGVVFNLRDKYGWVDPSKFRWTKHDYVVTRWEDEIWTFPKTGWEFHLRPVSNVDYVDPDHFRDSQPELTSW